MSNPGIENWTKTDGLYLWRYGQNTKNYPGWNLAADEMGWRILSDLLKRMAASPLPSRREIPLSKPTARVLSVVNNPAGAAKLESSQRLILELPGDTVEKLHWKLEAVGSRVTLELGAAKLGELLEAIRTVQRSGGDFAIGPDEKSSWKQLSLWLWLIPTPTSRAT